MSRATGPMRAIAPEPQPPFRPSQPSLRIPVRRTPVPERVRGITLVRAVLAVAPLAAALVFLAWVRLSQLTLGYEIGITTRSIAQLRAERTRLHLERATLRSPMRLATIAQELHLAPPRPEQVRALQDPAPRSVAARAKRRR